MGRTITGYVFWGVKISDENAKRIIEADKEDATAHGCSLLRTGYLDDDEDELWAQVDSLKITSFEGDAMVIDRAKVPAIVEAAERDSLWLFCDQLNIPWAEPQFRLAVYWD